MLECRNESVWHQREPTIAEILSDSMIKAMMRADRVDPVALERDLRSIARTIEANSLMPLRWSPRKRGPSGQALNARKVWIPASAGTNGECDTT